MNSRPPGPGQRIERDIDWMDDTYPLHTDLIDRAIDEIVEGRAQDRQTQAGLDERNQIYTRVTGPFEGYYVAAYGCPTGETGSEFIGSYKICRDRPGSYWDADFMLSGSCSEYEPSGFGAMEDAEAIAVLKIADL